MSNSWRISEGKTGRTGDVWCRGQIQVIGLSRIRAECAVFTPSQHGKFRFFSVSPPLELSCLHLAICGFKDVFFFFKSWFQRFKPSSVQIHLLFFFHQMIYLHLANQFPCLSNANQFPFTPDDFSSATNKSFHADEFRMRCSSWLRCGFPLLGTATENITAMLAPGTPIYRYL